MKFLTLLSAAVLVSATVSAQRLGGNHNEEVEPTNTGFGIKGGVNIASIYNQTEGLEAEGITSYHAGAYGRLGVTESFALQLEALYSRRGFDFKDGGDDAPKFRFDYIDVPLLFVYNVVGDGTFSIMAGPQASLMITLKDQNDKEIDKTGFHTFDFGAAGGVQFGYKILRAGVRYNIGFLDVVNENENPDSPYNFKNHFGQVYLGVEF